MDDHGSDPPRAAHVRGRRPRRRYLVVVAILALFLATSAWLALPKASSGGVIDGWLVGPPTACQDRVVYSNDVEIARGRCDDLIAAAAAALERRDPGHPAVISMRLHRRLWPPGTAGGLYYVVVYTLADGSMRGIGVGWPGVATTPYTLPYGP